MIHPGDVVFLADPQDVEPAPPPSVPAEADAHEVPATTAAPSTTLPPPTTSSTTTSSTTTTLPPPVGPEAVDTADTDDDSGSPAPIGLGQAALISTGIVALVAARRRAKLRAAEPPARLPVPNPDRAATERMLRRLDAGERLLRVDIALRAAAAELADGDQRIVVVRCAPDGTVEVHLTGPASLSAPWTGTGSKWALPGSVPVDDLATRARAVGAPCIALTQIGTDEDDWDVLVDLEATGLLAVDADPEPADGVVRALAIGLASSEFAEVAHLVGVGIDEEAFLGHRHAHVVPTVDEAIELAATLIGGSATTPQPIDVLAAGAAHRGRDVGTGGRHRRPRRTPPMCPPPSPGRSPEGRAGDCRRRIGRRRSVDAAARRRRMVARTARHPAAPGARRP